MPDDKTTETKTTTDATDTGTETETGGTQTDTTDWKAEAEKWKTLSRQNEERAKTNAEKAKSFDELEEANKTELEKWKTRAETAESKVTEFESAKERATVRAEVAKAKGIPEAALRGSSKEELEAHADELIELGIKPAAAATSDGQGDTGDQVSTDGEKSADEIVSDVIADR